MNFNLYTLNNRLLLTIYIVNRPAKLLGSSIIRLEVKSINSKPLKLELKDILYLPNILVNLFSR